MSSFLKKIAPESFIAGLAVIGIFIHLLLRFSAQGLDANYPLYLILTFGGGYLIIRLFIRLFALDFGSDLLAGISIITAILLKEYLAGSLVVLMLSGGLALESYAITAASRMLEVLSKRAPLIAHLKKAEALIDIAINQVGIGDQLVIFPHEICPVDGRVISGHSVMDESFLTGEPFLISKAPGSSVISGAINGDGAMTIRAERRASQSRYAKIMQVMSDSAQKKPKIRRLADQLGAWYTPFALMMASLAWWFSHDPSRFLAVLVIATPCPLIIAIPVTIIGSISLCAQRGILIKNPVVLEQLANCETMIFDKTGTLTYGKPTLTEQTTFNHSDPKTVLQLVASLERYSKHPLAIAIQEQAEQEQLSYLNVNSVSETKGKGLQGTVNHHLVTITNRKSLRESDRLLLPAGTGLECIVIVNQQLAAHYRFRDTPRKDSLSFIRHLLPIHRIQKLMIVSGDREEEVSYLAKSLDIKEVYANKTPEEKVEIVEQETKNHPTVYLGDGINDAPALLVATVGIAFGQNSDITSEAADAVIMENSLERVDELLHISTRMKKIALQSAFGGMALSMIGMFIAAFGFLPPVVGAIIQEIIDVTAIANALRSIRPPKIISDIFSVEN